MAKRKYYRIGKKRFLKANVKKNFKRIIECLYIGLIIGFILTIRIDGQAVEAEALKQAETATQVSLEEVGNKAQIESPQISRTVEEQIRSIAREKNFRYEDYLVRLAHCENDTFNPLRTNSVGNYPAYSIDRGIFMINDFWHREVSDECSFDVRCSTEWTIDRINKGYQHEWMCNQLVLK